MNVSYSQPQTTLQIQGVEQKTICASVKYPVGLLCVPLISKSGTGGAIAAATGFAQYESPFDTCPATAAPINLSNMIVQLGGTSITGIAMNYSFENFMQQVCLAESITSADMGLRPFTIGGLLRQQSQTRTFLDLHV